MYKRQDTFGATPKLDHLIGDSEAIDRSPRSEITKFIESDLLRALASGGLKAVSYTHLDVYKRQW